MHRLITLDDNSVLTMEWDYCCQIFHPPWWWGNASRDLTWFLLPEIRPQLALMSRVVGNTLEAGFFYSYAGGVSDWLRAADRAGQAKSLTFTEKTWHADNSSPHFVYDPLLHWFFLLLPFFAKCVLCAAQKHSGEIDQFQDSPSALLLARKEFGNYYLSGGIRVWPFRSTAKNSCGCPWNEN